VRLDEDHQSDPCSRGGDDLQGRLRRAEQRGRSRPSAQALGSGSALNNIGDTGGYRSKCKILHGAARAQAGRSRPWATSARTSALPAIGSELRRRRSPPAAAYRRERSAGSSAANATPRFRPSKKSRKQSRCRPADCSTSRTRAACRHAGALGAIGSIQAPARSPAP
jgi:hypothetical protein